MNTFTDKYISKNPIEYKMPKVTLAKNNTASHDENNSSYSLEKSKYKSENAASNSSNILLIPKSSFVNNANTVKIKINHYSGNVYAKRNTFNISDKNYKLLHTERNKDGNDEGASASNSVPSSNNASNQLVQLKTMTYERLNSDQTMGKSSENGELPKIVFSEVHHPNEVVGKADQNKAQKPLNIHYQNPEQEL